jgi:glycosyltransferase involved in cell wall biosynthesis
MKICFFCDSIFSFGGVQRVLAVIAKELAKSNDVTILTLDDPLLASNDIYELKNNNVNIVFFSFVEINKLSNYIHKSYSWAYKKAQLNGRCASNIYAKSSFPRKQRKELISKLNEIDADVVIGVHAFLSIKLATIRKQLNVKKVIGWMHNSYYAFFEKEPAYLDGIKWHFKYQMEKLDEIVVLTKTDANLYKDRLGLKTNVIYNPLTIVPRKRCNTDAKKFLAVGRLSPMHKGFDILINAFAKFAKSNSEWTLDIVGDGPEKDNLLDLITAEELQDRIKIHPFTNDIQSYYSAASVFILSSRWEGFPLVIMEALAHGLPIIASDIPVCREFLSGKDFCYLYKNENIFSLCNNMTKVSSLMNLKETSINAFEFSRTHASIISIMNQWKITLNNENTTLV